MHVRHIAARARGCGVVLALIGLAACSPAPSEPAGLLLVGTWGSDRAELVALRVGAEVHLHCAAVLIDEPITLSEQQTFAVQGRLDRSGAELSALPLVDVQGSLHGAELTLKVDSRDGSTSMTFDLLAAMSVPPLELPECPL